MSFDPCGTRQPDGHDLLVRIAKELGTDHSKLKEALLLLLSEVEK